MAKVTHKIQSVEFGLLSPEDIKRGAVAKVHEPTIYEADGTPRTGGVNDLRMGSVGSHRCSTCWHGMRGCSGHYGYIEFHQPQWHVGWLDVINKLLRCVCFWCSKALLPEEELLRLAVASTASSSYRRKQMVSVISNRSKTRTTCPHCDGPQPVYTRNSAGHIDLKWPEGTVFSSPEEEAFARRPFRATECRNILKHIDDDSCWTLGLNPTLCRPEWMILTVMLVPPPCIRPAVAVSDASRSKGQDDLTLKLADIVKANAHAANAATEAERERHNDTLNIHLSLYLDKDNRAALRGGKRPAPRTGPCRSLAARLKG